MAYNLAAYGLHRKAADFLAVADVLDPSNSTILMPLADALFQLVLSFTRSHVHVTIRSSGQLPAYRATCDRIAALGSTDGRHMLTGHFCSEWQCDSGAVLCSPAPSRQCSGRKQQRRLVSGDPCAGVVERNHLQAATRAHPHANRIMPHHTGP